MCWSMLRGAELVVRPHARSESGGERVTTGHDAMTLAEIRRNYICS